MEYADRQCIQAILVGVYVAYTSDVNVYRAKSENHSTHVSVDVCHVCPVDRRDFVRGCGAFGCNWYG